MATFLALLLATFLSEDLACITAGVLIQNGRISTASGVAACALGIFVGDVGLWALGRVFGRAVLEWPWTARRVRSPHVDDLRIWLDGHVGRLIFASRFLPGSRLPLYLMSGVVGLPCRTFAWWAFASTMVWAPAIVLLTAALGERVATQVTTAEPAWVAQVVAAGAVAAVVLGVRSGSMLLRTRPHP